jgi:hypothetical protein
MQKRVQYGLAVSLCQALTKIRFAAMNFHDTGDMEYIAIIERESRQAVTLAIALRDLEP